MLPVKPTRGARILRAAWWDCSAARTTTVGVAAGVKTSEQVSGEDVRDGLVFEITFGSPRVCSTHAA